MGGRVKGWRKHEKKIEMSLIVRTMCVRWNVVYSDEVLFVVGLGFRWHSTVAFKLKYWLKICQVEMIKQSKVDKAGF